MPRGDRCEAASEATYDLIASDPAIATVFLVARWGGYADPSNPISTRDRTAGDDVESNDVVVERAMARTIDALLALGREVILVGPVPEVGFDVPRALALAHHLNLAPPPRPLLSDFLERQRVFLRLASRFDGRVTLMLPHLTYCDERACDVAREGRSLYRDDHHLSLTGAGYLVDAFERLLAAPEP